MHFDDIPVMIPFKGPDAIERENGLKISLRLGANESVFGMSPRAAAAVQGAIATVGLYSDPRSYRLRTRINEKFGVPLENSLVASGVDELIALTIRLLVNPGDRVVATEGSYPTFFYFANSMLSEVVTVPYDNLKTDLDALNQRAREVGAKLIYLANPDNPTGTYHGVESINRFVQNLPEDCYLLLDEAYIDFTSPEPCPIAFSHERVIRCRSFSKAYAMAGLRIGYAVLSERLNLGMDKIRLHFGVNRLAQIAATESLADDDYLAMVVVQTKKAKEQYYRMAQSCGLNAPLTYTNFVLIDLGSKSVAEQVGSKLLHEGAFTSLPKGASVDQCIRISIGTADDQDQFCKLFERVYAECAA